MRLKVRDNSAEVERQLDALQGRILAATVRAENTLLNQAQKAGFAEIKSIYDITPQMMSGFSDVRLASSADPQAVLTVKGKGFPLSAFHPVRTATGMVVTIKGKQVEIPHGFLIAGKGLHVFARGSYGGKSKGTRPTGQAFGRFQFDAGGRGRRRSSDASSRHGLPIHELWTFAPPDCLNNERVRTVMDNTVADNAPKVLARELGAAARGF